MSGSTGLEEAVSCIAEKWIRKIGAVSERGGGGAVGRVRQAC